VTDPSVGITRISSDNEKGGHVAAQALAKLMGDKGSVIVISVKPGVSTTDARIKGFTDEMAGHPGIKVLPTLYDNDLPATAASQIQSTLAAHPDLGGVFAGNTNTGQGIATGLKQAHKQGMVKVAAFDAEPDEITALQAGTVQVLVAQEPAAIGTQGVDQLRRGLRGQARHRPDRHHHGGHHPAEHERPRRQQVLLQGRLLRPSGWTRAVGPGPPAGLVDFERAQSGWLVPWTMCNWDGPDSRSAAWCSGR